MTTRPDIDSLFIRVNARPRRDLERGYSYCMGVFGDESEAHVGLSGYGMASDGVEGAVERLHDRMGVSGRYIEHATAREKVMFVTVYKGREVGEGPDGEELFEPHEIIASFKTRDIASTADLLERLAALGIRDEG